MADPTGGTDMSDGSIDLNSDARAKVYATPLELLDPAQPELFRQDAHWALFERLRKEDPVHYTAEHEFGPYWSICARVAPGDTYWWTLLYMPTKVSVVLSPIGCTTFANTFCRRCPASVM